VKKKKKEFQYHLKDLLLNNLTAYYIWIECLRTNQKLYQDITLASLSPCWPPDCEAQV
jgi:hypothetical protein